MDKIIVIGGKGSGLVVGEQIYDAQIRGQDIEFLGYAFDDPSICSEINGFPLLCGSRDVYEKYEKYDDVKFVFQMWRPDVIEERIIWRKQYGIPENRYAIFVHPLAMVAKSAILGYGTVVLANSVVNSNVKVGKYVTIHSNVLIGHDTFVRDSCFIASQCAIGSNSRIGTGCFIGLNSSINNYISVGDYAFVGMASNVIKSIPERTMVYGNPARIVERKIKPL